MQRQGGSIETGRPTQGKAIAQTCPHVGNRRQYVNSSVATRCTVAYCSGKGGTSSGIRWPRWLNAMKSGLNVSASRPLRTAASVSYIWQLFCEAAPGFGRTESRSPEGSGGTHSWLASALMGRSSPARCRLPARRRASFSRPSLRAARLPAAQHSVPARGSLAGQACRRTDGASSGAPGASAGRRTPHAQHGRRQDLQPQRQWHARILFLCQLETIPICAAAPLVRGDTRV